MLFETTQSIEKNGLNPSNVEWFVDAIEMGAVKLPELQGQMKLTEGKCLESSVS
ncbi:MAG: hypothetical protein JO327_00515 [Nitrososphaeraceae archaeon]|nr:hypothetical protein [Nitrososphaeraceae archaeon]